LEGSPSQKEILSAVEEAGLTPLQIREVGPARHIFSHIEWHMEGYEIRIASASAEKKWIAADKNELEERYAVPSAYRKYLEYLFQGQRTKNS
ncbi:MAG: NUDIX domain-containing protein, partial [Eubacterium sp.]|nr:NUDIX domain-containing protein [Eubacterium sp.]